MLCQGETSGVGLWQQQVSACHVHTLLAISVSSMSVTTTLRSVVVSAAAAACTGAVRSGERAATHRAGAGTATKPCAAEQNSKSIELAPARIALGGRVGGRGGWEGPSSTRAALGND